jgi:two-component system chemotaxis response regulator CheB
MNAGAVDFVAKPDVTMVSGVEAFINDMIAKIKIASASKVQNSVTVEKSNDMNKDNITAANKIIAIGASTGGTEAVLGILKALPANVPGIVVVQHIPPVFSRMFAERLNSTTGLYVKEARTGDIIKQGQVFVAPGDQHVRIKKIGSSYKIECFEGERVNGHCPSVDVLFETVAKEAGKDAIGVILTGMGYDGAKGLLSMRRKGARTIGQDEKSAVVYGMPKVAFNIGAVEIQTSLDNIAKTIHSLLMQK